MIKHRGDSITLGVEFRDRYDKLFDPDTVVAKWYDPNGELQTNETGIVHVSEGIYENTYAIPIDGEYGDWWVEWTGTITTPAYSESENCFFTVKRKPGET